MFGKQDQFTNVGLIKTTLSSSNLSLLSTQLILEQHRFELCGSTYTQIFSLNNFFRYTIHNWLTPQMLNCGQGDLTVKFSGDFQLCGGSVLLTLLLFKGQL